MGQKWHKVYDDFFKALRFHGLLFTVVAVLLFGGLVDAGGKKKGAGMIGVGGAWGRAEASGVYCWVLDLEREWEKWMMPGLP